MRLGVNGIDVHYEVSGAVDGPWLFCVHSLLTDLHVWDPFIGRLERHFRVLRSDLRGHGETDATAPPYSLELLVADAIMTMNELEIDRAHVMGLSIGSMIALGMALEFPERIGHLVIADCRSDAPPPYVAMWNSIIDQAKTDGIEAVVDASLERWFSAAFLAWKPPQVEALRRRAIRTAIDGLIGCARSVQRVAYLPLLERLDAPVLFVVGENDRAATPEVMGEMSSRVPGSKLTILPGAGHLTPVEVPEAFENAVMPFLLGALEVGQH